MNDENTVALTELPGIRVQLQAHEGSDRLLRIEVTTLESADAAPRRPLRVALSLDRSGSMDGAKLQAVRAASATFIRSLNPEDRVAAVAYDDTVDLLFGLEAPSKSHAATISRLTSGGSTNLYDGWLHAAKLVGRGGRVILLSDGQANAGRFSDADSLAKQARTTLERFGVTTTTIGVGEDYDERLMAGMAREGGGSHYFAHTTAAIEGVFSQERYAAEEVAIESVTVRINGKTERFGHFWAGETKSRVIACDNLAGLTASIRYMVVADEMVRTETLAVPAAFGAVQKVQFEWLVQETVQIESKVAEVSDSQGARELYDRLRRAVLRLMADPSADEPEARAQIERLQGVLLDLQALAREFTEQQAAVRSKRSLQAEYNLMEKARAFTSFDDEVATLRAATRSARQEVALRLDPSAFDLAAPEMWIRWEALPVAVAPGIVTVALIDARDGFRRKEMERSIGRRVKLVPAWVTREELIAMIAQH